MAESRGQAIVGPSLFHPSVARVPILLMGLTVFICNCVGAYRVACCLPVVLTCWQRETTAPIPCSARESSGCVG
jgi:hypothetical protein